MHILIHDLDEQHFDRLFPEKKKSVRVISSTGSIRHCIGCFGCWVKTPGKCVIKDGYERTGSLLARAEQITVISRCVYGGYSAFVKNVLDRAISFLLPFFEKEKGKTRHKPRYGNRFDFSVNFYGKGLSREDRELAGALVEANGRNFHASRCSVAFFDSPEQLAKEAGI